jgi:hypothetical protein
MSRIDPNNPQTEQQRLAIERLRAQRAANRLAGPGDNSITWQELGEHPPTSNGTPAVPAEQPAAAR